MKIVYLTRLDMLQTVTTEEPIEESNISRPAAKAPAIPHLGLLYVGPQSSSRNSKHAMLPGLPYPTNPTDKKNSYHYFSIRAKELTH